MLLPIWPVGGYIITEFSIGIIRDPEYRPRLLGKMKLAWIVCPPAQYCCSFLKLRCRPRSEAILNRVGWEKETAEKQKRMTGMAIRFVNKINWYAMLHN
jgi:hypothetical protein